MVSNDINQTILHKAIIRGGIYFYEYADAMELINICRRKSLPILGIDSFIISEDKTEPFLEHSIDLSGCQFPLVMPFSDTLQKGVLKVKVCMFSYIIVFLMTSCTRQHVREHLKKHFRTGR